MATKSCGRETGNSRLEKFRFVQIFAVSCSSGSLKRIFADFDKKFVAFLLIGSICAHVIGNLETMIELKVNCLCIQVFTRKSSRSVNKI